jgi:signal transduction histidine kinase
VRAKQSFTAIGMYSFLGAETPQPGGIDRRATRPIEVDPDQCESDRDHCFRGPREEDHAGDGLLHDARNLVSAIGLYCDLLSIPGVLKSEHLKYPDELRLLGMRSQGMIEHLMRSHADLQNSSIRGGVGLPLLLGTGSSEPDRRANRPAKLRLRDRAEAVTLRSILDRCSGLLSRVAHGRTIEISYGPAADVPIRIAEESVERILVNLVRNGSAALGEERAAIRISAGLLSPIGGELKAWPFQRVRLVVEDSGCGMESRQLQALLSGLGPRSQGNHGIGFRVVRELVSLSKGEMRVASARGLGTRIEIEWPMADADIVPTVRRDAGMKRDRSPGVAVQAPMVRANPGLSVRIALPEPAMLAERHGAH